MRRNPFEELEEVVERMSKGFDGGMAPALGESVRIDVLDGDDAYVVTADLPGFTAEDIDVSLDDGRLHIEAERDTEAGGEETEDTAPGTERYIYRERTRERASRTVRLPDAVDEEAVSASHSNGVLTVELPKSDRGDGHTIDVE